MAIYIGGKKCRLYINGILYKINIPTFIPITNGIRLLSSDDFILMDSNGTYLIPNDYTESVADNVVLSLDNYILTDINGLYLTTKGE
jgi:hypothetical protein